MATKATDLDDDLFDEDTDDDDLEFDSARSGFVTMDDLKGRLLLITPTATGVKESKTKGQDDFETITAEVLVLDGGTTDLIDEIPFELEEYLMWGTNIVSTLRPKIKRGGRVLGRLNQHKAKGYSTLAWHLDEPTPEDIASTKAVLKARRLARQG